MMEESRNGLFDRLAAPSPSGGNGDRHHTGPADRLPNGANGDLHLGGPVDRLPNGANGDSHLGGPADRLPNGANGDLLGSEAGPSGRDNRGRFTRANPGGPGNPFARRTAQLRRVLSGAVSEADMEAVARKLLEMARAGDVAAARLLLAYVLGQPAAAVDPDTLDVAEWQIYRKMPVPVAEMDGVTEGVPLELACTMIRSLVPYLTAVAAEKTVHLIPGEDEAKESRRAKRRKRAN